MGTSRIEDKKSAVDQQLDLIETFRSQLDELGLAGDLEKFAEVLACAPPIYRRLSGMLDMIPEDACGEFAEILRESPEALLAGVFVGYFQGVYDGRALHEHLGGVE